MILRFCRTKFLSKRSHSTVNGDPGKVDYKILKMLGSYVWPKDDHKTKKTVGVAMGLLISGKILNIQVPLLLKYIVDHIDQPRSVFYGIIGYGAVRTMAMSFGELRSAVFAGISNRTIRQVSKQTFQHLLNMDMQYHLKRETGGLSRAIDRGTKGISFVLNAMVFHIFPTAFELSLVCGLLGWKYGSTFAVGTLASISAYTVFTLSTTQWRTKFRRLMNKADNEAATTSIDSLINIESVKYFQNESVELKQYDKALENYESASLKTIYSLAFLNAGQQLIFTSGLTYMMYLASKGIAGGSLGVGDLVMINALLFQLSAPLNFLGSVYRELKQSFIDMTTLFNLQSDHPTITNGTKELVYSHGDIEFRNVFFRYEDKYILNGLNLRIPGGKKVAVVGSSGCGKSTLLRMIFRHYDPNEGSVLIDGQNIKDCDFNSFRNLLAVCPQDNSLFNQSIMYNIRYGNSLATDRQVMDAARLAQCHDLIDGFKNKYDTQVGERGLILSGGEKQRILLARVILRNPKILLIDEATSALDSQTEKLVMQSINNIIKIQHTSALIIAHRLSTVSDADNIIVMDNGKVAESGTHDELINKKGLYLNMWKAQERQKTVK
eukprot:NODE_690_length_5158_cov_0.250494.p1 type:complete len:607 gc:universal NODE_690_length_5158_cov_0.250494:2592-4412(+)